MKQDKHTEKLSKRTMLTVIIVALAMPATIILGKNLGDRSYYFISLLLIIYIMIPFFIKFEGSKPSSREIAVLAVMCAVAILSRGIFAAVPHFKPMVGIIMITGAVMGAESGFLTGAISGFVSNFMFGQGPWTPWQMLGYGIAGLLAGIFISKNIISSKRIPFCIFGAAVVICITGPVLDTSTLFITSSKITVEYALAVYGAGLPVNAIHAAATAVTIFILSVPIISTFERIRKKYGIIKKY